MKKVISMKEKKVYKDPSVNNNSVKKFANIVFILAKNLLDYNISLELNFRHAYITSKDYHINLYLYNDDVVFIRNMYEYIVLFNSLKINVTEQEIECIAKDIVNPNLYTSRKND